MLALGLLVGAFYAVRAQDTAGDLSSERSVIEAEALFDRFECIEKALHARLPEGASVFVDEEPGLWHQRLSEFAVPSLFLVSSAARAGYVVSVEEVAPEQACSGVELRVVTR